MHLVADPDDRLRHIVAIPRHGFHDFATSKQALLLLLSEHLSELLADCGRGHLCLSVENLAIDQIRLLFVARVSVGVLDQLNSFRVLLLLCLADILNLLNAVAEGSDEVCSADRDYLDI